MTTTYRDDGEQLRQRAAQAEHEATQARGLLEDAERERDSAQSELRMARARAAGRRASDLIAVVFGCALGAFAVCLIGWGVESCANDRNAALTAGVVTDRYHSPAYDSHGTVCIPVGKIVMCNPTTTHHPETWRIRFDHDGASRVVSVSREDFDDSPMGSWFRVDGSREPEPTEEAERDAP